MAEESSFSLGGEDWGSLEVALGSKSLAMPFPLSLLFGSIIYFKEIPRLENQE